MTQQTPLSAARHGGGNPEHVQLRPKGNNFRLGICQLTFADGFQEER
jgi:hypothetical protein